jgi:hypothetical protein
VTEVIISNDDITVLGSPPNIELLIDIGPKGQRGSQFFVGLGNPNLIEIGQTPELNDLFLNIAPSEQYGYIYQYVSQPGSNTWTELVNIFPASYSINYDVVFESGSAEIIIPISDITDVSGLTSENFSVQYSIVHDSPIASSMQIPPLAGAEENLVINIEAAEYVSSAWAALDEQVTVHIHITIIEIDPVS